MRSLITRFSILSGSFFSGRTAAVTPMAGRKAMRSPDAMQWNPGGGIKWLLNKLLPLVALFICTTTLATAGYSLTTTSASSDLVKNVATGTQASDSGTIRVTAAINGNNLVFTFSHFQGASFNQQIIGAVYHDQYLPSNAVGNPIVAAAGSTSVTVGIPLLAGNYKVVLATQNASNQTIYYYFNSAWFGVTQTPPSFSSFTSTSSAVGTTATVTVNGTNFPSTLIINIDGQFPLCTRQSVSATQGVFSCPLSLAGARIFKVQTDLVANGGTAFGNGTFTVNAAAPSYSGFTTTSNTVGTTATVTVNGSNFPSTLIINIDGQFPLCTRQSVSATQGVFSCPLSLAGARIFKVQTDLVANGGTAFYQGTFTIAAAASTVTSITPTSARLDVPQDFIVTGTNLNTGMGFAIDDCEAVGGSGLQIVGTGTSTQLTFSCVPRLPGSKNVIVKTAPGGTPLFQSLSPATAGAVPIMVDHPARLGNASSRGIPAVNAVSLWNGNVHLEATDLAVPGKGVSFALTRSYNSYSWDYEAARGSVSNIAPWRFNWDLKLGYIGNNNKRMWVQREDGSGENFFKDVDTLWYPMDQGNFNTIKGDTPVAGQTTLLTREGLQYIFQNPDLGGKLVKILDHDGNGLTITRDANGRVLKVTDASNRIYSFTYDVNGNLFRVTDFTNRYVEYTWDVGISSVRIKTVRDVRGGITTYNYSLYNSNLVQNQPAAQFLLTSIVDPRLNTVRTYTYTDTVYGNWGAASVKDGLNNTWQYTYCANQPGFICNNAATTALNFETHTQPPQGAGGGQIVTRFDTAGRLIEQADTRSNISKTAPMPLTGLTSQTFNLAALPTQKQSALGALPANNYGTSYTYTPDNAGNLATLKDAENATTSRTWMSGAQAATLTAKNLHRVAQFASATGGLHGFTYNDSGNVLSYTPPALPAGGVATQLVYDLANGQLTGVIDGRGNASSRVYDADGNLTKATDPDTLSVQNTYDPLGRVLTTTDKRGNVTTNNWDAAGNLLSVYDALNGHVAYLYDANGNRSKMTDARGNVTNYTYDANNRLKTVERVIGAQTLTTTYNYDVLGRTTSTVNANSHADSTTYDGEGNVLVRANALAYTTQYVYDADNRLTQTTDPEGRTTDTTYDKVGRVKSVTTAAGTTSYTYDGDGRMTSSTDPRGKVTQYGYDAAGRLTALTDANLQVTHATYDANGNMLTVIDPNNHTTTYAYDTLNRPLTRTDANGQQWVTTYDQNGNVKTSTAPGNKITSYTYDALDRVSRVDYPDLSFVSYTYDANGNRLTMIDSTGTTRYTYDALDRMSSKTDPLGKTVSYSYDGIGNVATLGYPGGQSVSYVYDAGERLTSLTDWLGKTTAYTLNRAGQVTAALFGNNSRADMVYDMAGRMTSLTNKKADGSVISSHVMTLDANGNITSATQQLPLQPSLSNFNRVFAYDPGNRLATFNGGAVTHDTTGRITGLAGAVYSYNDRDQIIGIVGSQAASYTYNGEGHRVTRNTNGQTTRFVIDPNRGLPEVLAETDNAGTVQRNYVYGYGLVEQIDSAGVASYYHYDPTGSTLALTNAAGTVSDSYAYTPYGETTVSGSTVNPFRYVGKLGVMDDGNGMHYMRARYYRPDVARFMSLDQLAGSANSPQSLNRYAYVLGNPIGLVDPSGLWGEEFVESLKQKASALQEEYEVTSKVLKQTVNVAINKVKNDIKGALIRAVLDRRIKKVSGFIKRTGKLVTKNLKSLENLKKAKPNFVTMLCIWVNGGEETAKRDYYEVDISSEDNIYTISEDIKNSIFNAGLAVVVYPAEDCLTPDSAK